MARYIKANPKVAKFLNLENDRNAVKDGNYILWQGDMLAFGPLPMLSETLAKIGAIALLPNEAREEQDGTVCRPLPIAEDPRFVVEPTTPTTTEATPEIVVPGTEPSDNEPTESTDNTDAEGEGEAADNTDAPEDAAGDNGEATENETEEVTNE